MIDVSAEFLKQMQDDRSFDYSATIQFVDGRVVELTEDDLAAEGCRIISTAGTQSFPLWAAVCKSLQLSFYNDNDRFQDYDFYGATIRPVLSYQLSETVEKVTLGKFTITEPEEYGSTISIIAYDDFYKADKAYTAAESFPKTALAMYQECCAACGLSPITARFNNSDYIITSAPEGLTYRQIIGLIAMLAGGNAMIKNGGVAIVPYDVSFFDMHRDFEGGWFDEDNPYSSGSDLDGGLFNPWDQISTYDAGMFWDYRGVHYLADTPAPEFGTDDVVITGVEITENEQSYSCGQEGYVLSISNPLTAGNQQDAANRIGALLIGMKFRPFSLQSFSYPLAEMGDPCYLFDRKGTSYQSLITDVDFAFKGYTTLSCNADSPARNSSQFFVSSADVKTRQAVRAIAKQEVSTYDIEVQRMTDLMANAMGMFETVEELEDGSRITYLHDKPTLSASSKIWKQTAEGFTVSTDGGKTFKAGMDAAGNAVLNILSAIGINFDWAKGGTLTLGGENNVNGSLRVLSQNNKVIANISEAGIFLHEDESVQGNYFEFGGTNYGISIASSHLVFMKKSSIGYEWLADFEISGNGKGIMLVLRDLLEYFSVVVGSTHKIMFDKANNKLVLNMPFSTTYPMDISSNPNNPSTINGISLNDIVAGANYGNQMSSAYTGALSVVTGISRVSLGTATITRRQLTIKNGLITAIGAETDSTILWT